jgi:hypothetical protein
MTFFAHHRSYWWRLSWSSFFPVAVHIFSLFLYYKIEWWRSLFLFLSEQEMRICVYTICWTEERRREKKNSLKSRFSFRTRLQDGGIVGVRKRRKRRTEKCQSYDSEHTMAKNEGRVMDIWTNALVVVVVVGELCHFGRCVWSSSSFLILFDRLQ